MKKQLIFIPLIIALAAFGGWRILNTKPAAPKEEEHEEAGHKEEHAGEAHEEHGEEGHVELSPEALKNANLKIEEAGPATIKTTLPLYGKIASNEEALAHVQPRFPGIVKAVSKRLGETVEKGGLLAVIESNESLRSYEIKSEIAGTIIAKDVTLGESVQTDTTLFTVADLTTVWVDLAVYRQDFAKLKVGQPVEIHSGTEAEVMLTEVAYISPFGTEGSQTMLARCVVENPKGDLRPGLFVTAEIVTGESEAPVTVRQTSLQTLEGKTVIFVAEGDAFEARPVELGAKDGESVEVVSGLLPGDRYVSENSFLLKAEIGKGEAAHEH